MDKEEKIGMYTRNEIFEHLCENSDIGMLGRSMYDAVMSKIDTLQSQLEIANKKLDKIKEYCNEKLKWNHDDGNDYWAGKNNAQQQVSTDILSIIDGE